MRIHVLPVLFLGASCAFPAYTARRTVDLKLPAPGLQQLHCTSHNGNIEVTGDPASTQVELRAELSVRGHSQGEADDNLRLLSVGHDFTGGKLRIYGEFPEGSLYNMSPSFAFTLKVPQNVALELASHNGDITARGTVGAQRLESHNGSIEAEVSARNLTVETHNGRVGIHVRTEGPIDGRIESHNGGIDVRFGDKASTTLSASTHNGDITPPDRLQDARIGKNSLQARIGDGGGALSITTHNGDVRIR